MAEKTEDTVVDETLAAEVASTQIVPENSTEESDEDLAFEVFASRCPSAN